MKEEPRKRLLLFAPVHIGRITVEDSRKIEYTIIDLVFHSDRGCRYSSRRYQAMLSENGIKGSMIKAGCPYDNSCMESFFASLKKEFFYRREYATIDDVRKDLFYYIEVFYNRKRLHSSLGYLSPVAYRLKEQGGTAA